MSFSFANGTGASLNFPAFKTKRLDNTVAQPVNGRYRSIAGNKKSTLFCEKSTTKNQTEVRGQ